MPRLERELLYAAREHGGLISVINEQGVRHSPLEGRRRITQDLLAAQIQIERVDKALKQAFEDSGAVEIILTTMPIDDRYATLARNLAARTDWNVHFYGQPTGAVHYALVRANLGPAGHATVAVGGDCLRDELTIPDVFGRAKLLAGAMIRKAQTCFPTMPGLHGGKKGELLITDETGQGKVFKADKSAANDPTGRVLPHSMAMALSVPAMALGIQFANMWRASHVTEWGGVLPSGAIAPESLSPDVTTGAHWKQMCRMWQQMELDPRMVTCHPAEMGGFETPSAEPTGLGVATAAISALKSLGRGTGRHISEMRVMIEAAGGVTRGTIPHLLDAGVDPRNILVFDLAQGALDAVGALRGAHNFSAITRVRMSNDKAYGSEKKEKEGSAISGQFDLLIVNGQGNEIRRDNIAGLSRLGVKVMLGGANNIVRADQTSRIAETLHSLGIDLFPDDAISGGGWTMAVIGQLAGSADIACADLGEPVSRVVKGTVGSLVEQAYVERSRNGGKMWDIVREVQADLVPDHALFVGDELLTEVDALELLSRFGVAL